MTESPVPSLSPTSAAKRITPIFREEDLMGIRRMEDMEDGKRRSSRLSRGTFEGQSIPEDQREDDVPRSRPRSGSVHRLTLKTTRESATGGYPNYSSSIGHSEFAKKYAR